jgi:hypothetical protein
VFGRPDDIAADLWPGLDVDVDLGRPADADLVGAVRSVRGVLEAFSCDAGLRVVVEGRDVVPHVSAALAARSVDLYGVTPRPPTLEDVYFAIEAGIDADADTGIRA